MEKTESLWIEYEKTKNPEIREQLINEYAHIVKIVAGRLSTHMGQYVEYDDLISYGIFGLLDAIDKFDYKKGFKFETYATLRIRGEIIDNVRRLDWVPRTLRQKNKEVEAAYQKLENSLGKAPSDKEMAEELKVSLAEFREMLRQSNISTLTSYEDYLESNYDLSAQVSSTINKPEEEIDKKVVKELLMDAIDKLTDREKTVVSLYYFEDMNLKEISKILGVSESRVSQIHSKSILKLKTKLGNFKSILFE